MTTPLELLAPAANASVGMAAIDHGADAVYIGAPRFSARAAAGNTVADIAGLITYAHRFGTKVYVALNTILTDDELNEARILIREIHNAGADGLILQDVGLLECDLPPIPLIASTQMHNATPEKVKFLEAVGFGRVILARELSLNEIRAIREQTSVALESFVYGALCVSFSGQCYMSQVTAGRSGNRGVCAQPCRHRYALMDADGQKVIENKYLLSLKDLNLSGLIPDLVKAGVTSFKIEGRYKDAGYVKNVTAAFSRQIDDFIEKNPQYRRAGSGKTEPGFTPDLNRTFNRGYTRYFIQGRKEKIGAMDSPKSLGKAVGTVTAIEKKFFRMQGGCLNNGDGLCFFTASGELAGLRVNKVVQDRIFPTTMEGLSAGMRLFRNRDQEFLRTLEKTSTRRRVEIFIEFRQSETGISLDVTDEDGCRAAAAIETACEAPKNPQAARSRVIEQLSSVGNTIFRVVQISLYPDQPGFLPRSLLNRLRREALDQLTRVREETYSPERIPFTPNQAPYPEKELDYRANVLNRHAEQFYIRHGAKVIEPALETGKGATGKQVMTTRYCVRHELDACPRHTLKPRPLKEPLMLTDGVRKYRLAFECSRCEMNLYWQGGD